MNSKVIIIGAPRSGTNMLRNILCKINGVSTWPCDEINYIWRYGNAKESSDEFSIEMATPLTVKYIQDQFNWVSKKFSASTVVEKTCANSLRVPFVDKVVPGAKYIYIVRDGFDVIGSAKLRWTANLNILYLLKKVKFVPTSDLVYYMWRYIKTRIYRILSKDNRSEFWGPSLSKMDEITKSHDLNEICALQWKKCVESSDVAFSNMQSNVVCYVQYENFVINPEKELTKILKFIEIPTSINMVKRLVKGVSKNSIGKGKKSLSNSEIESLKPIISGTMKKHGYEV
jgi:hypothetical protein